MPGDSFGSYPAVREGGAFSKYPYDRELHSVSKGDDNEDWKRGCNFIIQEERFAFDRTTRSTLFPKENMLLRIFKRSLCVVTMILLLTNPVLLPYFSLPERKLL